MDTDGVRLGGRRSPQLLRIRPVESHIRGEAERSNAMPDVPLGPNDSPMLRHEGLKFYTYVYKTKECLKHGFSQLNQKRVHLRQCFFVWGFWDSAFLV